MTPRAVRLVTAVIAVAGAIVALWAAGRVLVSGVPLDLRFPGLVSAAGGIAIHVDRLGAFFLAIVAGLSVPAAIYGAAYTAEYDGHRSQGLFGVMFNAFLLGMDLVAAAGNIFTFVLAWELMAVSSYFLVLTEHEHEETRQAALWYGAMTHAGLVALLPMFWLMAPGPDATTFADLRAGAATLGSGTRDAVFLLALFAFGSKAGIVPLHVWLPRAHPAAPSHVSALMSGVMIKLGIYGLIRVVFDLLAGGPPWWGGLILAAGSASALLGVLYALTENDLKRLLAYSSVENVGIILIGLGAGAVLRGYGLPVLATIGFAGALFHLLNHACFKSLLFFGAGAAVQQTHTRNMELMGGLIKGMPQTAFFVLLGSAAIAALPPLNGFASEWLVFQSLLAGTSIPRAEVAIGFPLAVGVLALTSGLAAGCFVKAFGITFLALPRSAQADAAREPHWSMRAAMLLPAAGCVGLGLAAPTAVRAIGDIVESVPALAAGASLPTHSGWLMVPDGSSQISPVLMAALLTAVALGALVAIAARGLSVRRADTWGCGRITQTPRMEYTSSAFAEPLRRIFSELYRPTEDLSINVHPESKHVVQSITYASAVEPWFETALYDPIARAAHAVAERVRRLQGGSIHLYLLYVAAALLAGLTWAWWF